MLTLVTGATGLVGNNVVRLLVERGEQVRVLVRANSGSGRGAQALEGLPVELSIGDVCDAESVRRACRGAQRVVHAAAMVQIGWTGLEAQRAINVGGTRNVVAAAAAEGARLLYVSTVNTLGLGDREHPADEETAGVEPVLCPYVITKREAERVVLDAAGSVVAGSVAAGSGLDAVIVNPAYMLGPWDWKPSSGRMLLQIAGGWAKLAPPGGNDFCDVRDVATGILSALARGQRGRRYILSGEYMSFLDAWRMFARIIGVKPPWFAARRPGLWVYGHAGDLWGKLTGREPELNSAAVEMAKLEHHYSYARAAAELDYRPRPALEAAEAAWAWFLEHRYA
jgi:dihydroflavonol-4-reductase